MAGAHAAQPGSIASLAAEQVASHTRQEAGSIMC